MKHWYLFIFACAVTSMTVADAVDAKEKIKNFSKSTFIDQALREIKSEIAQGKGVFRIKKEYQLAGQEPLAVTTKIDYSGYRQPSTSSKKQLKDGQANQTIEVIYKPHDAGHLSLITRNSSNRGSHTEIVDISTVTCV